MCCVTSASRIVLVNTALACLTAMHMQGHIGDFEANDISEQNRVDICDELRPNALMMHGLGIDICNASDSLT
jgi:hypothetical protein